MGLFEKFRKKNRENKSAEALEDLYEYCPRCDANLTLQKGYSNDLPYWVCKGCGEMLINPELETDSDVTWFCDGCGTMLNLQPGFHEECGEWICTECGYSNKICESEVYASEDEYQSDQRNPYKGLSDDDVLKLSLYQDEVYMDDRSDIIRVRSCENGKNYVKKLLTTYEKSVYEYLKDHPIEHMPKVQEIYESDNCLIIIEDYISGSTVADLLEEGPMSQTRALHITRSVCGIVESLHNQPVSIIHRDIKPSNIIVTPENEVYLLDMNVAKWYDPDQSDDTRYMGTECYAAPEQVGYGLSASSTKTDIYAIGVLLNVMLTSKFPKEERAEGKIWSVIEKCISLNAEDRYTVRELIEALDQIVERDDEEKANR